MVVPGLSFAGSPKRLSGSGFALLSAQKQGQCAVAAAALQLGQLTRMRARNWTSVALKAAREGLDRTVTQLLLCLGMLFTWALPRSGDCIHDQSLMNTLCSYPELLNVCLCEASHFLIELKLRLHIHNHGEPVP